MAAGPIGFRESSDDSSTVKGGAESLLAPGEVRPFTPGFGAEVVPGTGLWVDPNAATPADGDSPFGLDDACPPDAPDSNDLWVDPNDASLVEESPFSLDDVPVADGEVGLEPEEFGGANRDLLGDLPLPGLMPMSRVVGLITALATKVSCTAFNALVAQFEQHLIDGDTGGGGGGGVSLGQVNAAISAALVSVLSSITSLNSQVGSVETTVAGLTSSVSSLTTAVAGKQAQSAELDTLAALASSAAGRQILTSASFSAMKILLGLQLVDNTSDASKPVSTAQAAAIAAAITTAVTTAATDATTKANAAQAAATAAAAADATTKANAAQAASQPLASALTAIAALATTPYGRDLLTLADRAALVAAIALVASDIPTITEAQVSGLVADLAAKVPSTRQLAGLDLSANRTAADIKTALAFVAADMPTLPPSKLSSSPRSWPIVTSARANSVMGTPLADIVTVSNPTVGRGAVYLYKADRPPETWADILIATSTNTTAGDVAIICIYAAAADGHPGVLLQSYSVSIATSGIKTVSGANYAFNGTEFVGVFLPTTNTSSTVTVYGGALVNGGGPTQIGSNNLSVRGLLCTHSSATPPTDLTSRTYAGSSGASVIAPSSPMPLIWAKGA